MTESQKLELRRSTVRERLGEIGKFSGDEYNDTIKAEERSLQDEYTGLEVRHRTALIAEDKALDDAKAGAGEPDAEKRERVLLRGKARLTEFLLARAQGRMVSGAEHELCAAAGVSGIPLELWDTPQPERRSGAEQRAITPAPGTGGINLDPIRPAVFAGSIGSRLGIEMPRVPSGTFASGTITTSQSAAALAKSGPAVGAVGAITVQTASPKRVSARLELTLEDIAEVGQSNFESILRQNLSLVLADALDEQMINGSGTAPNLAGIFNRLTDPTAAPTAVADFDTFIGAFAGGVDGLWANTVQDVAIVCGVETYRLSAQTFRDIATADLGAETFASYAMRLFGGWWTNSRMPAGATFMSVDNVQQAILYRKGRSMEGGSMGMRTAVCPHWGEVSIDDVYSGSASAERYFTMHVLLGDTIIVQPDAYAQVAFQVA